jgi:hypothetical protein
MALYGSYKSYRLTQLLAVLLQRSLCVTTGGKFIRCIKGLHCGKNVFSSTNAFERIISETIDNVFTNVHTGYTAG